MPGSAFRKALEYMCSDLALRPGRLSTGPGHGEHLLALSGVGGHHA